jgi:large subunit ribosomal protein L9
VEVILLENVRNLGKFGHKVKVAKGYGRNFLIPQGKAVPASFDNMAKFEARRAELEIAAKDRLSAAQERAAVISAVTLKISAKAAEEGKLYGSIGTLEISKAFKLQGLEIDRNEIRLPDGPFREIGEFVIEIQLHAEVVTEAKLQIVSERA